MTIESWILAVLTCVVSFMAGVHFSSLVGIRAETRRAADQLARIADRLDHRLTNLERR